LIKKCTLTSFIALEMQSEGNAPKNGEPTVGFSFTTLPAAHRSVLVKDVLAKSNVTTLEHPPYSADLGPADIYLFHPPKSALKGRRFLIVLTSFFFIFRNMHLRIILLDNQPEAHFFL